MAKKNLSLDTKSIIISLRRFLSEIVRRSTVIIIVASIGILIYSVMVVQSIIAHQEDGEYRLKQQSNRISGNFDKDTIDKVNNLRASSEDSAIVLPGGRRNPFIN